MLPKDGVPSLGNTSLVLSLLAAAAKGARVRINLVHLHTVLTGPGLVLNAFKVKATQSCPTLCNNHVLYSPWNSPVQNTGVGSCSLLQVNFSTQGSNPGLLPCRQILYQLSHQKTSRILEWVAYPFSSGSSWSRNWTRVSCTAGRFSTSWATREFSW